VSPPKIKFVWQTHPEEQLLFSGPRPILLTLQGISDGVSMGGTPGGRQFGLPRAD
jgi:hypothetical protein